jgi:transposase InsO family protein
MERKRFPDEQIMAVLREHDAGAKAGDLAPKYGVSEATLYNWKAKYGGLDVSEAKRLKALEDENRKLLPLRRPADTALRARVGQRAPPLRLSKTVHLAPPRRRAVRHQSDLSSLPGGRLDRAQAPCPPKGRRNTLPDPGRGQGERPLVLDFVHDQFARGGRCRILNVVDDVTRECLAAVPDTSISGKRVARELTAIIAQRGKPTVIISDHGTEFTSNAILAWAEEHRIA